MFHLIKTQFIELCSINTPTLLITTILIGAMVFYLEGCPKFLMATLLADVVAICKAVIVIDFIASDWLFYGDVRILAVALTYIIKLLKEIGE